MSETVGTLLSAIASSISQGLRIMAFSGKEHWGEDEHEQMRALESVLDEAKKDFQELSPLVNGQYYYENDKKHESLHELRILRTKFDLHIQNFKDWTRTGGPINPTWAKDTLDLRRELHTAQCRAARRIFSSEQEASARCLGAFLVYRKQRAAVSQFRGIGQALPGNNASGKTRVDANGQLRVSNSLDEAEREWEDRNRARFEELVACNSIGRFERFGEGDVAFVCDYCDGHIIWEDLESMPSTRTVDDLEAEFEESRPASPRSLSPPRSPRSPRRTSTMVSSGSVRSVGSNKPPPSVPSWQATGFSSSSHAEKRIVFAPIAIANHVAPPRGDWQARILCPMCGEDGREPVEADDDGAEDGYGAEDEGGFEDLQAFQEHMEWQHTAVTLPTVPLPSIQLPTSAASCGVM